jgi:hypothetical protein
LKKIFGITYISFSLIFEQIANKKITKMLSSVFFWDSGPGKPEKVEERGAIAPPRPPGGDVSLSAHPAARR